MGAFAKVPEGWTEKVHRVEGGDAARLLCCGSEVHFEIAPEFRGRVIFKNVTRSFLAPLFDLYGFLTTRVPRGNEKDSGFVERIGFQRTWEDQEIVYYMLTALPFEEKRKTKCQ